MYVVPIRWCPPTAEFDSSSPQLNNMDFNSPLPQSQSNGSEVDASRIPVGKTCHQCRQKTRDVVATCKNPRNGKPCVIRFCHKCLLNRYGEIVKEVNLLTNWMCPKCRGICNCSSCMKKRGQQPTGALAHIAKASGFKSVSEMLIKNASEDVKLNNVNNVDAVPSNEATLEKKVVQDSSEKTRKENSLGDMTRSQMDGPKAWGANDFFFDPASLASNGC